MYRRRSFRRHYTHAVKKYSNENFSNTGVFNLTGAAPQAGTSPDSYPAQGFVSGMTFSIPTLTIVKANATEGLRKVKNFNLTIAPTVSVRESGETVWNGNSQFRFEMALVYIPEGTAPHPLNYSGTNDSIYEPSQNIILSGVFDPTNTFRISTRLARNLNQGDRIGLLIRGMLPDSVSGIEYSIRFMVNCQYAISYS